LAILAAKKEVWMNFSRASELTKIFILLTWVLMLFGCTSLNRQISVQVPMNPDRGETSIYKKHMIKAALFISEDNKYYLYKGTPSDSRFSSIEHSFPLGKGMEEISLWVFSQYFREVTLVKSMSEASNFKIMIIPQIEDFMFRYDYAAPTLGLEFIIPTVSMKVQATLSGDGKRIWEKSKKSFGQKKIVMAGQNFGYEETMGEVTTQVLSDLLKRLAEELYTAPEVDDYLASIPPDKMNPSTAK
jgi:hypothetical protein